MYGGRPDDGQRGCGRQMRSSKLIEEGEAKNSVWADRGNPSDGDLREQGVHLQWGPCVNGPVINYMKEKKAKSNSVKMYYSKSF